MTEDFKYSRKDMDYYKTALKELKKERDDAMRMLWATVKEVGGRVEISEEIIQESLMDKWNLIREEMPDFTIVLKASKV